MNIVVFVTNNSEDIEVINPIDIWRRVGYNVDLVSVIESNTITLSNKNVIVCNKNIKDVNLDSYDAYYFPGGMGVYTINNKNIFTYLKNTKKYIICLCAATDHLVKNGLLQNNKLTGYPGTEKSFINNYVNNDVVVSNNIFSGKGPGCAFKLAFEFIKKVSGQSVASKLANSMIYKDYL